MFGDKNEPPSKLLSNLERILLVLAVALKVFATTIALSSSQTFHQYHSVEAFVPFGLLTKRIHSRAGGPCASSSYSIFIPNMTSRHDDYEGGRSTADNQGRSQGNGQPRHKDPPRRQEATTNAAPMYITIGKIIISARVVAAFVPAAFLFPSL
jgi:hypothetical protein